MESSQEFLAEIAANPTDLTPRLIYADWLEEQGDPRGEFIRVQCELAEPSEDLDRREQLDQRQEQLKRAYEREWAADLPARVTGWTFRCGFIESVEMSAEQFLKDADFVFGTTPLRSLTLLAAGDLMSRIVEHPRIAGLEGLHVERSQLTSADTGSIAAVRFERLVTLRLTDCRLVDSSFVPILDLKSSTLRDADFSVNRIRNQSFAALSVSRAFQGIQELNVMANEIRQTGAQQFALSQGYQALELLDIRGNPIGSAGASALFERFGKALRF